MLERWCHRFRGITRQNNKKQLFGEGGGHCEGGRGIGLMRNSGKKWTSEVSRRIPANGERESIFQDPAGEAVRRHEKGSRSKFIFCRPAGNECSVMNTTWPGEAQGKSG